MKYSIGDRVIVKESGERGIVVKFCSNDTTEKYLIYNGVPLNWHYKQELQTDLTAIEKQFGLLSKEVQEELKAVNNGENIEYQWNGEWRKRHENIYDQNYTYRLSPTYKQEEVKEIKCESDGQIYTSYPPQYRCKHCLRWWFCSEPTPECGNKVKEMTVGEIEAKLGHRVKVVKGE